jgi:hypothetical protein
MQKHKGGDERNQTLDARIYPVVSVGTKPPLVYVVEALTKGIASQSPSLPGLLLTCHKGSATKAHAKSPGYLDATFTTELPMKEGVLVPCTKPSSPLHTKPEGRRLQWNGTPRLQLRFTQEPTQGIYTLLYHSN